MESASAAPARRRPRRGSVERPVNTRLVRSVALLLVGPVVVLALTLVRTGPLPAPVLPPAFDGDVATSLTRELARDHPSRVPGSPGAAGAARWFEEKLALYGIPVEEDVWEQELPGLGTVELRNLAAVVRGTLDATIVVVAHRDNRGCDRWCERQRKRHRGARRARSRLRDRRDRGSVGAAAAAHDRLPLDRCGLLRRGGRRPVRRVAARSGRPSPRSRSTAWPGAPRPASSSPGWPRRRPRPRSSGRSTQGSSRRARARSRRARSDSSSPSRCRSVSASRRRCSRSGAPAIRLATAPEVGSEPGADELESLSAVTLARLGAAVDATIGSLDADVELPTTTPAALFLGDRAVRGWALGLLLAAAVVPFAAATLDLLARCRRRGLRLTPAWRALRRRLGFWLLGLAALGGASLLGALPTESALPPRPDLPPLDTWPYGVLAGMIALGVAAWLRERSLLAPRWSATADEELAGWVVALAGPRARRGARRGREPARAGARAPLPLRLARGAAARSPPPVARRRALRPRAPRAGGRARGADGAALARVCGARSTSRRCSRPARCRGSSRSRSPCGLPPRHRSPCSSRVATRPSPDRRAAGSRPRCPPRRGSSPAGIADERVRQRRGDDHVRLLP